MWTRAMALALLLAVGPLATAEPPSASPVEADLLSEADMAKVGVPAGLGRGQNSTEVGGSVVRMLLALTAVAGLAVGLGLLARRLGGARRLLPRPGRHLSVIESVPGVGKLRAAKIMEEIGIDVSSKEIQLESEEIGEEVYRQMEREVESLWTGEEEIKTERKPSRLYITADGTTVRTSEGNKEVKLGSVYETADVTGALASEIQYTGGLCDSEEFGKRLYVLASEDMRKQKR